jgi:hypothetical protein
MGWTMGHLSTVTTAAIHGCFHFFWLSLSKVTVCSLFLLSQYFFLVYQYAILISLPYLKLLFVLLANGVMWPNHSDHYFFLCPSL